MDDLISRQAAIEAMSESLKRVFPEHRQIAEKCLNVLPSAQEKPFNLPEIEQRWIPCSERLPEEDACYLVTTSGTNNDIIDIAYYTEGIWHKASRIKAWMPLPEPYGGEQNETN